MGWLLVIVASRCTECDFIEVILQEENPPSSGRAFACPFCLSGGRARLMLFHEAFASPLISQQRWQRWDGYS